MLCDDAYITELNQEWRGKAAATDVLSFPASDWDDLIPETPLALGDIIISLDTAHGQAIEQGYAEYQSNELLFKHLKCIHQNFDLMQAVVLAFTTLNLAVLR